MSLSPLAPALSITAGLLLTEYLKPKLGLEGLGATVAQCDQWRRIASWSVPATADERREASEQFNRHCRTGAAATAAGAAEAIAAGHADEQVTTIASPNRSAIEDAQTWLRMNPAPQSSDFIPAVIPAPACDPLDGACIACASEILTYNEVAKDNARRAYRRARCVYDCQRNTAAGHPEVCNNCAQFAELANPRPSCAASMPTVPAHQGGGDYQIPNIEWVEADPGRFPDISDTHTNGTAAAGNQPATATNGMANNTGGGGPDNGTPPPAGFNWPDLTGDTTLPVVGTVPVWAVAVAAVAAGAFAFGGRRR